MNPVAHFNTIFSPLLKNAVESIEAHGQFGDSKGGRICLVTRPGAEGVEFTISDNGVGIVCDDLVRVYEHGFTTKSDHHGTGLHYCAISVKEMAGSIELSSEGVGMGAVVRLFFPYEQQSP